MKSKIQNLVIEVDGGVAVVRYRKRNVQAGLKQQQLLAGIGKVVKNPRAIKGIEVSIKEATFSTTRQVVAVVNTLAWQLGVKVNGHRQLRAIYSGQPNITKPQ